MKPYIPEPLPIRGIDWAQLIPLIGKANRALASYEGILYGVPNPAMLLSPLATQEAVISSRIEGTQANLEDVLKFEAGENIEEESRRLDIFEIINYRTALSHAEKLLKKKPLCLNTLLELHGILLDSVRGYDKGRGKFRTIQNWIGSKGMPIEAAEFVPPDPLIMKEHLYAWEKYYHSEEPDLLVHLAVIHAQFEIIHPFLDGNGRIGRILIPLFLYEKNLLSGPNFYISSYLEENRDHYVTLLRKLCFSGNWNRWIEFFLGAIIAQSENNIKKAKALQDLYENLKQRVIKITKSQFAVPLLDYFFERPIFKSSDLIKRANMPSAQTVLSLLNGLKNEGVLHVITESSGRRPQTLALLELIRLCAV